MEGKAISPFDGYFFQVDRDLTSAEDAGRGRGEGRGAGGDRWRVGS